MTTKDEALKMALDALELATSYLNEIAVALGVTPSVPPKNGAAAWYVDRAIATCREALAKKDEQEPFPQLKRIHPLDVPLEVFLADISTRAANVIRAEMQTFDCYKGTGTFDIEPPYTVRHLCMFSKSEMKRWPNFGKKCLNEVCEMLRARGLQLWDQHDKRSMRLLREHPMYFKQHEDQITRLQDELSPPFEDKFAALVVSAKDAEIARLNNALRWEQSRAERVGTHGPGCWKWGPSHYECALREIEKSALARGEV